MKFHSISQKPSSVKSSVTHLMIFLLLLLHPLIIFDTAGLESAPPKQTLILVKCHPRPRYNRAGKSAVFPKAFLYTVNRFNAPRKFFLSKKAANTPYLSLEQMKFQVSRETAESKPKLWFKFKTNKKTLFFFPKKKLVKDYLSSNQTDKWKKEKNPENYLNAAATHQDTRVASMRCCNMSLWAFQSWKETKEVLILQLFSPGKYLGRYKGGGFACLTQV